MNPEIKKLWTDALRSGKYPQGRGHLHDVGGYCCLGVLCELAFEREIVPKNKLGSDNDWITGYGGEDECQTAYVPKAVREWAGLEDSNPPVPHEDEMVSLAYINDHAGEDFATIATLIEENL